MEVIKQTDEAYPKRLLKIQNPPKQLYVEGNTSLLNKNLILAIVGTRKATTYGEKYCKLFSRELSKNDICIISGMAIGIDTIAHINSMQNKGKTIAVLGSGFNHIFPEQNKILYNKILENEGCIITEYEPGTEVDKANFQKRNRIISGISMGVLVVEATYRSGSTITAKYAIKQNKEVFCIPNKLDVSTGYSTNLLIKNGANLVMEPEDILHYYVEEEKEQINVPEEYKEIYNLIGQLPISANELAKITNNTISQTMQILSILELEGLIKSVGGNQYIKVS